MAAIRRLPRPIYDNYEWQERGACRQAETAIFFSTDKELPTAKIRRETVAKGICAECPVVQQCLSHALRAGEAQGVWGGLNERERAALTTLEREAIAG